MSRKQLIDLEGALNIALDARNSRLDVANKLKVLPRTEDTKDELIAYRMAVKTLEAKLENYKKIVEHLKNDETNPLEREV
jgi:hypothetical protein